MSQPYEGDSADRGVPGVKGMNSAGGVGVWGEGQSWEGVHGVSHARGAGVAGFNDGPSDNAAHGVWGESQNWEGIHGIGHGRGAGIAGFNDGPPDNAAHGVWGESQNWEGVHGVGHGRGAGVAGFNDSPQGGPGVWGGSRSGDAAYFEGNVTVTGDVVLAGADCAEEFATAAAARVEPGTVMVIGEGGALCPSQQAYDRRVAGVVAGGGDCRPGIVLDRRAGAPNRAPIALVGKVYCKVDATDASIALGDLLTTSATPGHAMKAVDPAKAFGAVLGKALGAIDAGSGLIPVLIALQ